MKYNRTVDETLGEYVALVNNCEDLFKSDVYVIRVLIQIRKSAQYET